MKQSLSVMLTIVMMVFLSGCVAEQGSKDIEGVVEAPVLSQICEVPGKIIELNVELGQEVKEGDVIARLDDRDAKYGLEQLEATLIKKKAILTELNRGVDPEQIKQGKNNITIAEQNYENTQASAISLQEEYDRQAMLFEEGAIPKTALDGVKQNVDAAERATVIASAQLDNAKQQLRLLTASTHQEKIESAKADIAQTESQIKQAKANIEKYQITAIADGVVINKHYSLGDVVNPGYNLMEVSSSKEKYLVGYLPVEQLSEVTFGQEITVKKGEELTKGVLCYIDVQSQYTPKDMQTSANKNKESVKIKVRLPEDTKLIPGERAEIVIN